MNSIEQYAELCARMADTGADLAQENAIAAEHGMSPNEWQLSKASNTARMSDPKHMGKTALAFMPLYQAAQARARGGKAPCSLEFCTKVHAEVVFCKDATGAKKNHHLVLAENGTHHQAWLACEGYWTPLVGAPTILRQPNLKYEAALSQKFAAMMQNEADRIHGIRRG